MRGWVRVTSRVFKPSPMGTWACFPWLFCLFLEELPVQIDCLPGQLGAVGGKQVFAFEGARVVSASYVERVL